MTGETQIVPQIAQMNADFETKLPCNICDNLRNLRTKNLLII